MAFYSQPPASTPELVSRGQLKYTKVSVASSATTDITGGNIVEITGTTTITAFTNPTAGSPVVYVIFTGILTLTHSANLLLINNANITTAAEDTAVFVYDGSSVWRMLSYSKKNGALVNQAVVSPGLVVDSGGLKISGGNLSTTGGLALGLTGKATNYSLVMYGENNSLAAGASVNLNTAAATAGYYSNTFGSGNTSATRLTNSFVTSWSTGNLTELWDSVFHLVGQYPQSASTGQSSVVVGPQGFTSGLSDYLVAIGKSTGYSANTQYSLNLASDPWNSSKLKQFSTLLGVRHTSGGFSTTNSGVSSYGAYLMGLYVLSVADNSIAHSTGFTSLPGSGVALTSFQQSFEYILVGATTYGVELCELLATLDQPTNATGTNTSGFYNARLAYSPNFTATGTYQFTLHLTATSATTAGDWATWKIKSFMNMSATPTATILDTISAQAPDFSSAGTAATWAITVKATSQEIRRLQILVKGSAGSKIRWFGFLRMNRMA